MAPTHPLARTPFFSFGRRPFCEQRLAAYVHREHRRGRPLREILEDGYVERCGGRAVANAVLLRPELIAALERDVIESLTRGAPHPG